jgi:uncharacterized protein YjbJ (UPF0337 family)
VKGAADKVKGAIKDAAGKVTGDKALEAEGKLDKTKSAAHNAVGDAEDAVRNATKTPQRLDVVRLPKPPFEGGSLFCPACPPIKHLIALTPVTGALKVDRGCGWEIRHSVSRASTHPSYLRSVAKHSKEAATSSHLG